MSKQPQLSKFSPIWRLAQLTPQPRLQSDCATIVHYFERLGQSGLHSPGLATAPEASCPLREDTVQGASSTAAQIRRGAPALCDDFFSVPPVMPATDDQ